MTSREIAELTGKRHGDVKRDIRVLLEQLGVDVSKFTHSHLDVQKSIFGKSWKTNYS